MKPLTDEEIETEATRLTRVILADDRRIEPIHYTFVTAMRLARDGRPVTFEEALNCYLDLTMKPLDHRALARWGRDWERAHGQRAMPTQEEVDVWLLHKTHDCLEDWERGFRSGARNILLWLAERDKAQKGEQDAVEQ